MNLAQPLVEADDDESKRRWQGSSGEQAAVLTVERRQRLRVGLSSGEIDVGSLVSRGWWWCGGLQIERKSMVSGGLCWQDLGRELCK